MLSSRCECVSQPSLSLSSSAPSTRQNAKNWHASLTRSARFTPRGSEKIFTASDAERGITSERLAGAFHDVESEGNLGWRYFTKEKKNYIKARELRRIKN
ncbi:hypothetical protein PUN28_008001 [Cardiocondyla obscurior]|uniref:Uncharacterized protein n=1 Tax=Cardiocondyla obscurior TaxID=286306 RepID=A0AAW2FVK2_9HYME